MSIDRRVFLKQMTRGGAAAAAAAVAPRQATALQREPKRLPPNAVGLLYDSTLCVGCKACVAGCKRENGMPPEITPDQQPWNEGRWDTPKDLSGQTLNVIKAYQHGTMAEKDHAENGYAFIKRQCLHCVDPSCVSCCPVSAMEKDPDTGIVSHDPDRCIGCRYCAYACPFQVPKFEFNKSFGQIQKCQLCKHRLAEGKLPGCVDSCPTGATLFGRVEDLRTEAHRRIALSPGDVYAYPRGDLNGRYGAPVSRHEKVIDVAYQPEVYGETVLGGTQAIYLASVPFERLGLPHGNVPDHSYASQTEGVQHLLYRGMVAPAAVLGGLVFLARRTSRAHHEADDE